MKKIAIDEATSKLLDELTESSSRRRSRAALVRTVLRQYAERQRRRETEAKDGEIYRTRERVAERGGKAGFLRCRIPNLCRGARRCLYRDLRPRLRRSPRTHNRGRARTGRWIATNFRHPLRFSYTDVQA